MNTPIQINYQEYESPFGEIVLLASHRGLVRLILPNENREFILQDFDAQPNESNFVLQEAIRQLNEYFAGERKSFDIEFDADFPGLQENVLRAASDIEYGETVTYKQLADKIESTANRAVGTCLSTNPLPIIIPCHRIIKSDGSVGGYLGGKGMKETLLSMESDFLVKA